ncbi:MAG: hypothetical protein FWG18_01775 [Alphaproteobacteria bacterium]|nr:hypothetical protein [Alphaproteobacteria bacterium]
MFTQCVLSWVPAGQLVEEAWVTLLFGVHALDAALVQLHPDESALPPGHFTE